MGVFHIDKRIDDPDITVNIHSLVAVLTIDEVAFYTPHNLGVEQRCEMLEKIADRIHLAVTKAKADWYAKNPVEAA